ncbi:MAG TPA: cupin domain-containing protein [Ignavibacteria bacterium]|nr:cupin domain-containing protein [Ignavibacteria bacterium]HMR40043.1 cupin domain-containing protein [Ignavibacteria bacterium]
MTKKTEIRLAENDEILNSSELILKNAGKVFKADRSSADVNYKKNIRAYNNLLALFSIGVMSDKMLSPDPSVKKKLFKKLKLKNDPDGESKTNAFEFRFSDAAGWIPHPDIKGIKIRPLSLNNEKGYFMMLMKASAGSEYPPHHHNGAEECFVLAGDLLVEGRILGPGDFHHAEKGSDHGSLKTKKGCTLLLVVDPEDS